MKQPDDFLISLNKHISDSGFCSRREADKLIEQERVTVNGHSADKGYRVRPGDVVEIDGEPLKKNKKTVYIACNKPQGITSTTDLRDKTNIITFLNHPQRIFPVGRLDKDSDGLILLTNDGDIVNKILRASNNHEKEYIVVTDKPITPEFIQQMANGVPILGTRTKKCEVRQEGNKKFRIILTQGLNRQIRRMCEYLGYEVVKLTRIRIMNINLGALAVGHWRYLGDDEMARMNDMMRDSSSEEKAAAAPKKKKSTIPADTPLTEKEKKAQQRKEAFLQRQAGKQTADHEEFAEKKVTSRAEKARREREKYLKVKKETEQRVAVAEKKKHKLLNEFEAASFREQSKIADADKPKKKMGYKEFRAQAGKKKTAGAPKKGLTKKAAPKKQAPRAKRK
jgi:23S rRNA pseudouridine2604 synthase